MRSLASPSSGRYAVGTGALVVADKPAAVRGDPHRPPPASAKPLTTPGALTPAAGYRMQAEDHRLGFAYRNAPILES
jgi:hypothetical protein